MLFIMNVVYYESIQRELKIEPIYECRYDGKLKRKTEESTRLTYTGLIGELEHPKIKTRLIDVMGTPSKLSVIRKDVSLVRVRSTLDLNCDENTVWWKWNWSRLVCGT